MLKGSRTDCEPILFVTKQVTVSRLGDESVACQPTPSRQIDCHAGIGRPNLYRLTRGEVGQKVSNLIQGTRSASLVTSIIKGVGSKG
jgi:hypothetical protein